MQRKRLPRLNPITKHNDIPISRTDVTVDRLGQAQYFSKLDVKTSIPQIRFYANNIEKPRFKNQNMGYMSS